MKRFNLKKTLGMLSMASLAVAASCVQTSCSDLWSEQHPGTYYVNSGETVASFLESEGYKENFSDFVTILKRAGIWTELRTYGEYTCFAPDNNAIESYLKERRDEAPGNDSINNAFKDVESLPQIVCDSIAKTHLCRRTFYCSQMNGNDIFPYPNLHDRYLSYYSVEDSVTGKLIYQINHRSTLVEIDDTVQNGVVHIIDKVLRPSNAMLGDLLREDDNASIFYDALIATGLYDTLVENYVDLDYPGVGYDSTAGYFITAGKSAIKYSTGAEATQYGTIPEKRYFKYTLFVVSDSVLESKYGITSVDGLREKAASIYAGGSADEKDRTNSLNRFISYHILPHELPYRKLNLRDSEDENSCHLIKNNRKYLDQLDVEDFYETLMPHSLMKISTPYFSRVPGDVYINRKGTTTRTDIEFVEGVRVSPGMEYSTCDNSALNGFYHYIDGILAYDDFTKNQVLNTRMRVMANTLSPDFTNSGATHRFGDDNASDKYSVGFLKGYCKNFEALNDQTKFWVRYADKSFSCWMGYEMTINGHFDISMKLPPVPYSGTYEVRIWAFSMESATNPRGIVQFFFREGENNAWKPCGIPVDLRIAGKDARIGNIQDDELTKDEVTLLDKAMRSRGYMKAMDSYVNSGTNGNGDPLRDDVNANRVIVTTQYMSDNTDYYLRMRQLAQEVDGDFPFNFVEIVPKSIYAGLIPEDKH